jgi:CDP-glycerol glycerophosphotransferase (TagB/SpsB family)
MELSVRRLKRTRPAQFVKREILRRGGRMLPRLSVVVPFHDAVGQLGTCVESLLRQSHPNLEIVLVDDGSTDGSADVARSYARRHRNVRLVSQRHRGVGAARNAGVAKARGQFLAFCDADDTVPATGYERLADTLRISGSDLAIGSVTLQVKGEHREPLWARRSNARRLTGITLDDHPEVMANLMPGTRVFRRSFWDQHHLSFASEGDHSDVVTIVRALLLARMIDIVPAVTYRWRWREDGRSLWQQGLLDRRRVADRVGQLCTAGELVVAEAGERVQRAYFAEVLHTTVPDLVRAAITRDDGYWETLGAVLARLLELTSDEALAAVPAEDRLAAWLCAHDERAAAEDFLEYSFDNQFGYPYRMVGDRPHIDLPVIEAIADMTEKLTATADAELRFRTRLLTVGWGSPEVLRLTGAAFIEYVDDSYAPSEITVVVRDRATDRTWSLPTTAAPEVDVNQWASRANEDHARAGFRCEIDVAQLTRPEETLPGPTRFDVEVQLVIGAHRRRDGFHSRAVNASAGLLEPSTADGVTTEPGWRAHRGLELVRRSSDRTGPQPTDTGGPVQVAGFSADELVLRLEGRADQDLELALVGPRARTEWSRARREGERFTVDIDVVTDEWGVGRTPVPADRYSVVARLADGSQVDAQPTRELWRGLPQLVEDSGLHFTPHISVEGTFKMRVVPAVWRTSRPPYLRRRLRDEVYPAAREQPLLDVVLFETFAGKAAGDNPGAICKELAGRGLELDLVFSVIDHSIEVPSGARKVIRFSREYYELLGRARYLIVNASLPYFFRKREGQLYFQTWHGSPLKRIAHDRPHLDFFNWHHRRQLLIARDGWDYLLSQSEFCTRSLCSAFRYDGPVLELGYPRNDLMLSTEADAVRRRTRAALGLSPDQRVVLYAPTWRDNLRVGRVFEKVLYLDPRQLVDRLDGDTVVLIRGHYNSVKAAEDVDPDRRVIDVTRYPDIADLYVASDALVTDYSSVFFDYVLTDKPMVFLAPDLVAYRDDNRGFYLDYEVVPGPICVTTPEVADALNGPDEHREVRREFRAEYAPHDNGKASARVVDRILSEFPPGSGGPAARP